VTETTTSYKSHSLCPLCQVESVKKQYTWKGILCATFCFPCGIYWCVRKKIDLYCTLCGCQVSNKRSLTKNAIKYATYKNFYLIQRQQKKFFLTAHCCLLNRNFYRLT
ncbi:unnamed protein product, partial [Enterobius vermicularis]|uniref:Brain protein I3 n=1 Tax=Enterobius vermicularis TaxID=51028 RepID=A0A0N4V8S0_ENTVE